MSGKRAAWDGVCPMCRESYSSYLDHLEECDVNELDRRPWHFDE